MEGILTILWISITWFYVYAMRCVNVSRTSRCFVWKMPSSERCIKHVRFGFISHFKMEKSDSTDDVFANAVFRPPQNARKQWNRPPREMPHASSKNVFTSCFSMTARNLQFATPRSVQRVHKLADRIIYDLRCMPVEHWDGDEVQVD